MLALLYTHYIGSFYVFAGVLAVLISRDSRRVKLMALSASGAALVCFLPWLVAISGVYRSKHGLGANLDWQGHPSFFDLKAIWAASLGISSFRGATSLSLVIVVALCVAALALVPEAVGLRASPPILALMLMAFLPPIAVYLLSIRPINLPIFGFRHLLPSIAVLLLLCCYGWERVSGRFTKHGRRLFVCGAFLLLLMEAAPTARVFVLGPSRVPYDKTADYVLGLQGKGITAYTTSRFISTPVNFYCRNSCVQILSNGEPAMPNRFLLLYRTGLKADAERYASFLRGGYTEAGHVAFSAGPDTRWGTTAADLERRR
jgi:hypothetical protein